MRVGSVREVWRYPVKSMVGERLDASLIAPGGVLGDRGWALRDELAGEIRGAKKLPGLLRCAARYVDEPREGRVAAAEITLPDGAHLRTDHPEVSQRLSTLVGRKLTLCPLHPADDREHYRRAAPDNPDMLAELREIFGRLEDEPLPDISIFPAELMEFTSPLGTYFDAFPIHLLTTASLAELGRRNPGASFDVRRFRPNVLIDTAGADGFVETDWCGKSLRVGRAVVSVALPTARCVMTTLEQPGLEKDPSVLRTIVRDAGQNVGVYASVADPGAIKVGDPVELV
jgi:uncharacterized protein